MAAKRGGEPGGWDLGNFRILLLIVLSLVVTAPPSKALCWALCWALRRGGGTASFSPRGSCSGGGGGHHPPCTTSTAPLTAPLLLIIVPACIPPPLLLLLLVRRIFGPFQPGLAPPPPLSSPPSLRGAEGPIRRANLFKAHMSIYGNNH